MPPPPQVGATANGPRIAVTAPSPSNGDVIVPIYAVGTVGDQYQAFTLHLRWNPAVFSFSSASEAGAVFDPGANPSTGFCVADHSTFDADGGGVVVGCSGFAPTLASGRLFATITLAPVATGCSVLHLYTFGGADGGDEETGSFTVNAADQTPQVNAYTDGSADTSGNTCTPPAPPPAAPASAAAPLAASGTGACVADVDRSGLVNIIDLSLMATSYLKPQSDPAYKPWADLNGDGRVNILDFSIAAASYDLPVNGCLPCRPFRASDFPNARNVGWSRTFGAGTAIGGVYADLLNYSGYGPWVDPPRSFTDGGVFTVVQLNGFINPANHVTFGWEAIPYGQHQSFIEYTDSSGNTDRAWFPGPATGSTNTYTILYNNPTGDFSFQLNSASVYHAIPAAFAPDDSQIYSETKSFADQMPGGGFSPEVMSNAHIWDLAGWVEYNGSDENPNPGSFKVTDVSATERHVEDLKCAA